MRKPTMCLQFWTIGKKQAAVWCPCITLSSNFHWCSPPSLLLGPSWLKILSSENKYFYPFFSVPCFALPCQLQTNNFVALNETRPWTCIFLFSEALPWQIGSQSDFNYLYDWNYYFLFHKSSNLLKMQNDGITVSNISSDMLWEALLMQLTDPSTFKVNKLFCCWHQKSLDKNGSQTMGANILYWFWLLRAVVLKFLSAKACLRINAVDNKFGWLNVLSMFPLVLLALWSLKFKSRHCLKETLQNRKSKLFKIHQCEMTVLAV